jgi:hypothetical protein
MTPTKKDYDLVEILEMMQKYKAVKVKLGGLEVELSPDAFKKIEDTPIVSNHKEPIGSAGGAPTDDEMLFWSTPTMPNIQTEPINQEG